MSQLEFSGEESFSVSREVLWAYLTNLRNVPPCVPNLRKPEFPTPDKLLAKLDSSFTFIKGTLDLAMEVKDRDEPRAANVWIDVKGLGSHAQIEVAMEFAEPSLAQTSTQQSTRLKWRAQTTLSGLLRAVSKGLVKGTARKIIADTFAEIHKQIASDRTDGKI